MAADPSSHTGTAYHTILNTTNAHANAHRYDSLFALYNPALYFVNVICPHLIFAQLCANSIISCGVLNNQLYVSIL
jgi:hypothetical protein